MRALPVAVAVLLLLVPIAGTATVSVGTPDATVSSHSAVSSEVLTSSPSGATVGSGAPSPDPGRLGTPVPQQTADENRTFRTMSVSDGGPVRVETASHGANLGPSLDVAVDGTSAAMETETLVQQVDAAETSADRRERILDALDRVERGEERLYDRQQTAIRSHASGDLSNRELLDELVRIAAAAREYERRLDALDTLADETNEFSTPSRFAELSVRLQVYEGPVRDHALAAASASVSDANVQVQSSDDALVLATITDGQYVREVIRLDRWVRDGGSISNDAAINAVTEAYPETVSLRQPDAFGAGSIQRVSVPHEFGLLRTYVSGGTTRVFVEHQRIDLDAFTDIESVTEAGDGFDVTVDRSYAGGPVTVTVRDEESGDPVSGVTVTKRVGDADSQTIGETDDDGVVRTLSPADTYRITVVDEPRVVVVEELEPIATPAPVEAESG
ncbi:DUF7094 domain-containing protein [Halorubrum laminariae]|uniref:Carboxypeptidase regulatory-like domain-containing protein n=1 Tax=Halorubrum laminariae TaxID=1433523 RepID=A0ABD6C0I6_9EURY|nr:hypothetical protein [Halorubrum laminariae]